MQAIYKSLNILLNIIEILIVVRILLSWIPISRRGFIVSFVYDMTEPVLAPCRNLLYKIGLNMGMFDFSPILAMLLLRIVRSALIRIFFRLW